MKRVLTATAAVLLATGGLLLAFPAQAQMYWRLDTGWSKANDADLNDSSQGIFGEVDDVGDSFIFGGGVGYRFSPSLRGDLTLAYRGGYGLSASKNGRPLDGDVTSTVLMASAYHDFSAHGGIRPFVGAGLGFAQNSMEHVVALGAANTTTLPDGKKNNTAFALMAGVGIPVSDKWTLEIGYRYVDLGKIRVGSGAATSVSTIPVVPPIVTSRTFNFDGAEGKLTAHEITIGIRF